MTHFTCNTRENIKAIVMEQAGVLFPSKRQKHRPVRMVLVTAVLLACLLSMTVYAESLFSPISGDELALNAVYEGDGIVVLTIENRSHKVLRLQDIKLMRWSTSEEVASHGNGIVLPETKAAPQEKTTLRLDLTSTYDTTVLEVPLSYGDHYYFLLTNNSFLFGHDWICSISFAEPRETAAELVVSPEEKSIPTSVEPSLRFYFEADTLNTENRRKMAAAYTSACETLFETLDAPVLVPVSAPISLDTADLDIIFDDTLPADKQDTLVSLHRKSVDADFHLLSWNASHTALVLGITVPNKTYPDTGVDIPLRYYFTYEKQQDTGIDPYLFVCGQLLRQSKAGTRLVYEDESHMIYDMSELVWQELTAYASQLAAADPNIRLDETAMARIEAVNTYFSDTAKIKSRFLPLEQ